MGVKISDLRKDSRTITFDFVTGENDEHEPITEPVTITYRPGAYNGDVDRELTDARKGDYVFAFGIGFVRKLVTAWDLVTEDEQGNEVPYPLDDAALNGLPDLLLARIVEAVVQDMGKARQLSTAG